MATASPDSDLGAGGKAMWADLAPGGRLGPGELSLVLEICRIKDRLDQLNKLISGDITTWIDVIETYEGSGFADISINKPLAEARQQALAFKGLMAELRQIRGGKLGRASAGGSVSDDLAAKRAQRIATAQGAQRP